MRVTILALVILALIPAAAVCPAKSAQPRRVTIPYDAFGAGPGLKQDWGYSAFIEYDDKRILFDTGNDSAIFAANVKKLGIDLKKLDFVVLSHRHSDHTS